MLLVKIILFFFLMQAFSKKNQKKTKKKKTKRIDAIWNNSIDGHSKCYGTSPVESINNYLKSKNLLQRHTLITTLFQTRIAAIKRTTASKKNLFKK